MRLIIVWLLSRQEFFFDEILILSRSVLRALYLSWVSQKLLNFTRTNHYRPKSVSKSVQSVLKWTGTNWSRHMIKCWKIIWKARKRCHRLNPSKRYFLNLNFSFFVIQTMISLFTYSTALKIIPSKFYFYLAKPDTIADRVKYELKDGKWIKYHIAS